MYLLVVLIIVLMAMNRNIEKDFLKSRNEIVLGRKQRMQTDG